MQLKNHEWILMNTNLRTRTMIQPFAPQSLNDSHPLVPLVFIRVHWWFNCIVTAEARVTSGRVDFCKLKR
jgi:hypothetical protein